MAPLEEAANCIQSRLKANIVLAAPLNFAARAGSTFFQERIGGSSIQVIEGETSDALAHADLAIAASGTVTVEAAILGTPMVTFYKVTALSWALGPIFWFVCRFTQWLILWRGEESSLNLCRMRHPVRTWLRRPSGYSRMREFATR